MPFSTIVNDFDINATVFCGQCFAFKKTGEKSVSGLALGREISITQDGNILSVEGVTLEEWNDEYVHYFGLDTDYDGIKKILSKDPTLKEAITFSPGIRIMNQPLWETTCSFIISQNNNITRITGIVSKIREMFGESTNGTKLFPTPEALASLTIDDLAPLRSGYRAKYIIDAANKFKNNEISENLLRTADIETARKHLRTITGVGPKVADCILLFSCERLDICPMDVWMKRVMSTLYPDGFPEYVKPYAGIAQQYLFNYARLSDIFKD